MEQDAELEVMGTVHSALMKLADNEARQRVLDWVASKLSLSVHRAKTEEKVAASPDAQQSGAVNLSSFDTMADLFAALSPERDKEKALLAAAFLQGKSGETELTGHEINVELKHLGHGLNNVTDAINQLMARSPKLMMQVRKEGKTQQAKKKYKVTVEGFRYVQQMLNPSGE